MLFVTSIDLDFRGLLPLPRKRAAAARRHRLSAALYLLCVLVGLVVLALTGPVSAQEPVDPCDELRAATTDLEAEPTSHELESVAGMWFPGAIARLMLCEVRELRLRRREIGLTSRELRLWETQVTFTERQRDLAVEARDRLEEVVEAATRRAREAESEVGAWYRSPILWVVVGIVVGGGILIGGAYLATVVP